MNDPVESTRIVTTDDSLKLGQTDALQTLEDGMKSGLRKLEADYEASAENVHDREASVSDAVRHSVEAVISTLKLPESDEGLKLVQSIIDNKAKAESAMQVFQTGRPDALGKITMGLHARGD
jgi:hypothetical protein